MISMSSMLLSSAALVGLLSAVTGCDTTPGYRDSKDCTADVNCKANTCHSNGCDQCNSGYWKYDYDSDCVACDIEGCKFCRDFDGCGQCEAGWTLEKNDCGYYVCVNPPTSSCDYTIPQYGQCGGRAYSGDNCCYDGGLACVNGAGQPCNQDRDTGDWYCSCGEICPTTPSPTPSPTLSQTSSPTVLITVPTVPDQGVCSTLNITKLEDEVTYFYDNCIPTPAPIPTIPVPTPAPIGTISTPAPIATIPVVTSAPIPTVTTPTVPDQPECPSVGVADTDCPAVSYRGNMDCSCDSLCKSSTCHSNGCDQCKSGSWKRDYDYNCQDCSAIEGCKFCQDFNGCGQCVSGYKRVKSECGYYVCEAN